ncbi:MAG: hypothetical protein AAGF12_42705, partial [Myxococcota bacterium]
YQAAVLAVPGGRVASIIRASELFGPLLILLRPTGSTEGDIRRFFPVLQTTLDRGDSASYGPYVFQDRPLGGRVPSVLLGVALDDDTVPNVSNYALARAMRVPIAPEVLRPVVGLEEAPQTPISGNFADGQATGGLLQFDVILRNGTIRTATHGNTPASGVGARAWLEFLQSQIDDGLAQVVDPYALEGIPHATD